VCNSKVLEQCVIQSVPEHGKNILKCGQEGVADIFSCADIFSKIRILEKVGQEDLIIIWADI